mmetsp:Transcript_2228/g.5662  ORF Transcript_2228/g.5662 Transcript_2228/m.5662 type:complete len:200 (+) Transcript_2228:1565-2164(+)
MLSRGRPDVMAASSRQLRQSKSWERTTACTTASVVKSAAKGMVALQTGDWEKPSTAATAFLNSEMLASGCSSNVASSTGAKGQARGGGAAADGAGATEGAWSSSRYSLCLAGAWSWSVMLAIRAHARVTFCGGRPRAVARFCAWGPRGELVPLVVLLVGAGGGGEEMGAAPAAAAAAQAASEFPRVTLNSTVTVLRSTT